jgi:hypothetical protein
VGASPPVAADAMVLRVAASVRRHNSIHREAAEAIRQRARRRECCSRRAAPRLAAGAFEIVSAARCYAAAVKQCAVMFI